MRPIFARCIAGLALGLGAAAMAAAQTAPRTMAAPTSTPLEIRLWPDGAPGSENWSYPESVTTGPSGERVVVANVSDPTLTVFLPDPAIATGTAVVIAPGGALRALAIDNEGVKVAQWLNSKGIAGFVLKYRTRQQEPGAGRGGPPPEMTGRRGAGAGAGAGAGVGAGAGAAPGARAGAAPRQEIVIVHANANPAPDDEALTEVLEMAVADAQASIRLVRANAAEWRIDPARVGIMGFSAGGGVGVGAALAEQSDASPDFLVSLYGPSLQDVIVPAHAGPLFIAVGATHFNVTSGCLALFSAWKAAGKPAEIHVYDGVSAGFGMTERGLPVDGWKDRFHEWLVARELTSARN